MDARDILDAMIIIVIIIGTIFAGRRFYQDMTRPLDRPKTPPTTKSVGRKGNQQ